MYAFDNTTGTTQRALSYVYDDYRTDAKPVNGIPLANVTLAGNLMYTVSHDAQSGKHSARFEAYTAIGTHINLAPYTVRYFHTDHLGSITAITDETGAVVERLAYDAWGWSRISERHLRAFHPAQRRRACWRADLASGGGSEGCGRGAAAGLFGSFVSANTTNANGWNAYTRGMATTVTGGVTSRMMGGSFADGATTAAYGYLFNCVAHKCSTSMYDRDDPSTHLSEPIASPILCNTSTAGCLGAAQTELGCNSAPGQNSCTAVGETESYTLTGGNGVTQYRPSTDMIINGTDVNHILADGYVVRWLAVNSAGDFRIWSAGYGTNTSPTMAFLNKVGGFFIFTNKGNNNWKNLAPYRANQ